MAKKEITIQVLMGIGERAGQWLTDPDDAKEIWHPSRAEAMADAAQHAADHDGPVVILADDA